MADAPEQARRLDLMVEGTGPVRLDRALAQAAPPDAVLTRTRMQQLIRDGMVSKADGTVVINPAARCHPGETWIVKVTPLPVPSASPADIPLVVVHEDSDLLVVDKPAGMTVHPAPGSVDGTLLNAVMHHCGGNLADTGDPLRPGIVHRIDKNTSGLLVVAKTRLAHVGLSGQFAAHDVDRLYTGFCHGVPETSNPRVAGLESVSFESGGVFKVTTQVGRSRGDRKKMAVMTTGGRHAVTRFRVVDVFPLVDRKSFAKVNFWLETGRTHQIRLHMQHLGHPLVGDPQYGGGRRLPPALDRDMHGDDPGGVHRQAELNGGTIRHPRRQALHAAQLGFVHPKSERQMTFESPLPDDLRDLERLLVASAAPEHDRG